MIIVESTGSFGGTIDVLSDDPDNAITVVSISGTAVVIFADPGADFDGNGSIDFADFLMFAEAFGTSDIRFDLDLSSRVDFGDFLIFAESFGRPLE